MSSLYEGLVWEQLTGEKGISTVPILVQAESEDIEPFTIIREYVMIQQIIKQIYDSYYWDARVKSLECNYFGDEVKLVFEDGKNDITYHFEECYKVKIEHEMEYPKDKASKDLTFGQIPYFMQDVDVKEIKTGDKKYMAFKINMYPINLQIVCSKFHIC